MENIRLDENDRLWILDQSLLPNEEKEIPLDTPEAVYEAIYALRVRGAPAIGICAAYALYVISGTIDETDSERFIKRLEELAKYLVSSRPTAVNLGWAAGEMLAEARACRRLPVAELRTRLRKKAVSIHRENIEMCLKISELGLSLVHSGDGILTHCNAGALATSHYGTALGPIVLGRERGVELRVFADETRPLLQGARLTAYELSRAGVDVTLICDNMASAIMKNGWIQACFVGCDRVAANGDTANKIGTSGIAVLAKHYGIPFYVLGPTSSIDTACPSGSNIEIELRPPEEIRSKFYARPMAPVGVKCYNPAFDVTDHSLITAIVTEKGILYPPYDESIAAAFK